MERSPKISVRKLHYFLRVADTGGMRAAAATLNVSQPALGAQIKELEDLLGVALLERHNRGIALTVAGRAFLSHARDALEAIQRAEQSMQSFRDNDAPVRLGVTPSVGRVVALQLLSMGQTKSGNPRFVLQENVGSELIKLLQAGELDATLCYDPPDGLEAFALFEEDLFLVGRPEAIGSQRTAATARRIASLPLAIGGPGHASRQHLERFAEKFGVALQISVEIDSISLQRELLLHRDLCTVVPRGLFLSDILAGRLVCAPIKPAIRQTMKLVVAPSCAAGKGEYIRQTVFSSIKDCAALEQLGWRLVE